MDTSKWLEDNTLDSQTVLSHCDSPEDSIALSTIGTHEFS